MREENIMAPAFTTWKEAINISHLHRFYNDGQINIVQLGKAVASRLKLSNLFHMCEPEIIGLIVEFESLDEFSGINDYNSALQMLYEYGDENNTLWIETENGGGFDNEDSSLLAPEKTIDSVESNRQISLYGPTGKDFVSYVNKSNITSPNNSPIVSGPNYNKTNNNSRRSKEKPAEVINDAELETRLAKYNVKPGQITLDMASYMKTVNGDYLDWLIQCKDNFIAQEIKPQAN